MKKVLLLLIVAISFVACEGPEGPMGLPGMDGQDGQDGYVNFYTRSFTIQPDEWELIGTPGELNSYFVVDKELPSLTSAIYNRGAVVAYIETGNGVKNLMPYVLHKGDVNSANQEILWTQTYDFDYSEGWVGFYLTYSDFNTHLSPTDPETFHVVLMW